jgi:DNA mismatch repair ATPase MutS
MQKKLRHSKFRNTGILFELLTKQITADILAGRENSEAKTLLFKYFKENTELGKEWRLYNFLLNEKVKDEVHAERFLTVIVEQRKKLHNNRLAEEKYNLIKEMKELYPIDQFLKASIKNYKVLASTYKIFENASSKDAKFDVKEVFQAKNCIIENIADSNKKSINESEELIKFYQQQSEDIRLLSYKLLVEGLNKKYSNLDDNQKSILREYINNVSNTNSLGEYICNKIDEVKQKLVDISKKILDSEVIKIKINEVTKQLDKVRPTNSIVKDNQIMSLLLSYELLKEVTKQLKKEEAPNG